MELRHRVSPVLVVLIALCASVRSAEPVDARHVEGHLHGFLSLRSSHVWILEAEAPAFVRAQAQTFMGAPMWQTDLVSPVWPRAR
jgi:hypothetical protein